MGRAHIVYINISLTHGTKTIISRKPEVTLIKKVFDGFDKNASVRSPIKQE